MVPEIEGGLKKVQFSSVKKEFEKEKKIEKKENEEEKELSSPSIFLPPLRGQTDKRKAPACSNIV